MKPRDPLVEKVARAMYSAWHRRTWGIPARWSAVDP